MAACLPAAAEAKSCKDRDIHEPTGGAVTSVGGAEARGADLLAGVADTQIGERLEGRQDPIAQRFEHNIYVPVAVFFEP